MLGNIIKEYINEKGLKQSKIAKTANITVQAMNDILNERRKIDTIEYFKICKAFPLLSGKFQGEIAAIAQSFIQIWILRLHFFCSFFQDISTTV